MAILSDTSKTRDQWPAEWHYAVANGSAKQATKDAETGAEHVWDRSVKDKLADGVLKVATFA